MRRRSSPRTRSLSVYAMLTLMSATAADAQVRGVVQTANGAPVPDAIVSLWREGNEVAQATSDQAGRFRFGVGESRGATTILARRIGFRPTSIALSSESAEVEMRVEQITTSLPTLVVTASAGACEHPDDPKARQFWQALADHYVTHSTADALKAVMWWRHEEVESSDVGEIDERRLPPGEYGVAGSARAGEFVSIEQFGYARRLKPGELAGYVPGVFLHWRYAALQRDLSEHFVQQPFATLNALSMRNEQNGTRTISFCGRSHHRPYLEGTLTIGADTSLMSAEWTFHTPKPDESAGGEVVFLAPPAGATLWQIIPARSAFWRRIGGHAGQFFSEVSIYRSWYVGPDIWP